MDYPAQILDTEGYQVTCEYVWELCDVWDTGGQRIMKATVPQGWVYGTDPREAPGLPASPRLTHIRNGGTVCRVPMVFVLEEQVMH